MNLHSIASAMVGAVNATVLCTLKQSSGYTVDANFVQQPQYAVFASIPCQIQPVSTGDLRRLSGMNQQGVYRRIYLNGHIEGVDRTGIKGGDIFIQSDNTVWLVTEAAENWPDWTSVVVTLQNGG